jgi:glucose/arabinose dehydrogenase
MAVGLWVLVIGAVVSPPATSKAQTPPEFDPTSFSIGLELIADGLEQPVYLTGNDDGTDRLFVVERQGRIRIVVDGTVLPVAFLDITTIVQSDGSEQGLLSVAFPPDFSESGEFYVYYTAISAEGVGDNTIARYRVSEGDPNQANAESGQVLIAIPDFRKNHNGGLLLFGPDGYLYAGLGDGGGGGDPDENGQNPETLLGSIVRIDPSTDIEPYAIPDDNPFADSEGGRPEVWLWGVRNPWRFSFDRDTGDLFVADVGQGAFEEVNWLPAGTSGGSNLGWNVMEGTECFRVSGCDAAGLTLPVAQYSHDFGCSVTGGYIYRGAEEPGLDGIYLFGDYCTGLVWGMTQAEAGGWLVSEPVETGYNVSSFGEDANGEMYLVSLEGEIFRITDGD